MNAKFHLIFIGIGVLLPAVAGVTAFLQADFVRRALRTEEGCDAYPGQRVSPISS